MAEPPTSLASHYHPAPGFDGAVRITPPIAGVSETKLVRLMMGLMALFGFGGALLAGLTSLDKLGMAVMATNAMILWGVFGYIAWRYVRIAVRARCQRPKPARQTPFFAMVDLVALARVSTCDLSALVDDTAAKLRARAGAQGNRERRLTYRLDADRTVRRRCDLRSTPTDSRALGPTACARKLLTQRPARAQWRSVVPDRCPLPGAVAQSRVSSGRQSVRRDPRRVRWYGSLV